MQIHELNNFTGTLGASSFLPVDNGTDTGKISTQQLLAPTEARIDNIIAGDAPSAAEVTDARFGADGVTYTSLGTAIRTQVSDLKADFAYSNDVEFIQFSDPALMQYINTAGSTVQWDTPSQWTQTRNKWAVVPCSAGDVFTISGTGGSYDRLWAFANSSKQIIGTSGNNASATNLILAAPANSAYLIINDHTNSDSFIGEMLIKKYERDNASERIDRTNFTPTGNLYETTLVTWQNGYIDGNGNEQTELTLLQRSDYIPCSQYKFLYAHFYYQGADQDLKGAFYDKNKVFISAIKKGNENHPIPPNAVYARLNSLKDIAKRTTAGMYAFFNGEKNGQTIWAGKTINALGDSITYGYGLVNREADRWTTLIANMTGATVNNYGVSSSKISEISGDAVQSFVDRVTSLPIADLTIVFGGTNDYWHQLTTIGDYDSTNTAEFCGALNYVLDTIQTANPSAKILFVFPMHQYFDGNTDAHNFGKGTFNDFRIAAKEVCVYKGVPMLDLYADSGTNVAGNSAQRSYYTQDGVHPNVAGHKLIADLIDKYIEFLI